MIKSRSTGSGLLLTLLIMAACGDSSGPEPVSIRGNYTYTFGLNNAGLGVSCQGTGQMSIAQQGSQFTGQGNGQVLCTGPTGQIPSSGAIQITGGQIDDRQVSFQFPLLGAACNATGNAAGTPVNNLAGTAACSVAVSGLTIQLNGNWQASR
ncbi:MAG: hypothetical protein ACRENP_11205 [Longimicrobiales bacterium]